MSTQLFGRFNDLIKILKVEMEKTFKSETNFAFNLKIVNGDSRKYNLENRASGKEKITYFIMKKFFILKKV